MLLQGDRAGALAELQQLHQAEKHQLMNALQTATNQNEDAIRAIQILQVNLLEPIDLKFVCSRSCARLLQAYLG